MVCCNICCVNTVTDTLFSAEGKRGEMIKGDTTPLNIKDNDKQPFDLLMGNMLVAGDPYGKRNFSGLSGTGVVAYKFNENFSMAIQPNVNYSALKIHPNPLANPSMTAGYPNSDNASAIGFGAQVGMYFKTNNGRRNINEHHWWSWKPRVYPKVWFATISKFEVWVGLPGHRPNRQIQC